MKHILTTSGYNQPGFPPLSSGGPGYQAPGIQEMSHGGPMQPPFPGAQPMRPGGPGMQPGGMQPGGMQQPPQKKLDPDQMPSPVRSLFVLRNHFYLKTLRKQASNHYCGS